MYTLINKSGIPLSAFHQGDLELKNILPCRRNNYIVFKTKEEAQMKLDYIKNTFKEEYLKGRWDLELCQKIDRYL